MSNVIPMELPRPIAQDIIRRLAGEGQLVQEPVFITKLRERDFTMRQVLDTLTGGAVNQGPVRDEYGDWRCRVRRRVSGRLVRVVVAIHDLRLLYLISVH